MSLCSVSSFLFFFNDTATTEIYTLSLHDALPISRGHLARLTTPRAQEGVQVIAKVKIASAVRRLRGKDALLIADRKSTRLNSSHSQISYAVFCLKKKKTRR